jgi:predicted NBD/HSP70 family sugar kinase
MNYAVVDVGGTFIKYAVMTAEGEFLQKGKIPTETQDLNLFLESIANIYREAAADQGDIAGVALSMPGFLDVETGYAYNGGGVRCVKEINLIEALRERIPVPVTMENDARCAALAELWHGNLAGCRNAAAVILGTGVGGGIIVNGEILRGKHFVAGELSYFMLEDMGVEFDEKTIAARAASARGLVSMVAEAKGIPEEELDGVKVFRMIDDGDAAVREILWKFAGNVARLICSIQIIIDPERVVVGGGISTQPLLIEMIRDQARNMMKLFSWTELPVPDIVPCKFFNDSNLIGALYSHKSQLGDKS